MAVPDANATVVDDGHTTVLQRDHTKPTFHVSREMVCFLGGIAVALGVMWAISELTGRKRGRD